ncbi:MAG: hypothetical protein K0S37_3490 [Microbacterium sp.]|nr:hypothetical protein [Microbacterium sp.]
MPYGAVRSVVQPYDPEAIPAYRQWHARCALPGRVAWVLLDGPVSVKVRDSWSISQDVADASETATVIRDSKPAPRDFRDRVWSMAARPRRRLGFEGPSRSIVPVTVAIGSKQNG